MKEKKHSVVYAVYCRNLNVTWRHFNDRNHSFFLIQRGSYQVGS